MIKQVCIRNFQSHKQQVLEFHPGVNVIAGSSNSGKSAILRSIRWLLTNKPNGEGIISHWAFDAKGKQKEDTSVTVEFDNITVTRARGKEGNTYKIGEQVLEAFGANVPPEVVDACNFTEVNLQSQLELPFLLADSGGEVARFFNKIVKLDKIDSYMEKIASKKRKTKAELTVAKENLQKTETDLATYAWLPRAGEILDLLDELSTKYTHLSTTADTLKQSGRTYEEAEKYLEKTSFIGRAEELIKELQGLEKEASTLDKVAQGYSDALDIHTVHVEILSSTEIIPQAEKLVNRIKKLVEMEKEVEEEIGDMKESLETYESASKVLDTFEEEYAALKKQMPKTCPTCGKAMEECKE